MALQARRFFLDVQSRQFVSSPDSSLPASDPSYFDEDVEAVELFFLQPTLGAERPYDYVDLSGATVKFAVGVTSPAALQSAWTSLSTVVTTGVTSLVTGGAGAGAVQELSFSGANPANGGFALQFPARTVSVTSVSEGVFVASAHGLYNGQSVVLSGFTITGSSFSNDLTYVVVDSTDNTFSIAISASASPIPAEASAGGSVAAPAVNTPQIAYDALPSDVESAIAAAGLAIDFVSQIAVTGTPRKRFVLVYGGRSQGRAYDNFIVVGSTLSGAQGLAANVSFNTTEVAALVTAGTTNVTMEIEVSQGAARQTFQRPATLSLDIITSASPSPVPANLATSFDLESPDGSVWTVTITDEGELQLAKQ